MQTICVENNWLLFQHAISQKKELAQRCVTFPKKNQSYNTKICIMFHLVWAQSFTTTVGYIEQKHKQQKYIKALNTYAAANNKIKIRLIGMSCTGSNI